MDEQQIIAVAAEAGIAARFLRLDPVGAPSSSEEERARLPTTLPEIERLLGDCTRCPLCETRKNIVFGTGSDRADLVILGEAPGEQEDRTGEPFVGKAGKMLDRMLANVLMVPRPSVYITNVVKCRPPHNRDPHVQEVEACFQFLSLQLQALRPKAVLAMGSVAYRALFRETSGIRRNRGEWKTLELADGTTLPVMPTYHPAYLLRLSSLSDYASRQKCLIEKRRTHADLLALKERLGW